jgi:two-component system C4-dicarboxylate transport response regulator DctD
VSRILVIDDEHVIRELMREILERAGHETIGAETPLRALELLEDEHVELVVSDIVMPGLSGLELLAEVHARRPNLPVLLVTGAGTQENLREAVRRGAAGLVIKPFSHAHLHEAVSAALKTRADARDVVAELRAGRGTRWDRDVVDHVVELVENGELQLEEQSSRNPPSTEVHVP